MKEWDMNVISVNIKPKINIKHECDKCEYKAIFKSDLTKHKQPKHEGVRYECDQCEYKATDKDNPSKHKKFKH